MTKIFHPDGSLMGEIELSEKQVRLLEGPAGIDVMFHTPRMLQGSLGKDTGKFSLRLDNTRIVTGEPNVLKRYLRLQEAVKALQKSVRGEDA